MEGVPRNFIDNVPTVLLVYAYNDMFHNPTGTFVVPGYPEGVRKDWIRVSVPRADVRRVDVVEELMMLESSL